MMDTDTADTAAPLALGPELTIAQAAETRELLLQALAADADAPAHDLTLDLSAVTDIDSAGLQLLLAARRSLAERGASLRLLNPAGAVLQALDTFSLGTCFDQGALA